jgi:hypothetical protein
MALWLALVVPALGTAAALPEDPFEPNDWFEEATDLGEGSILLTDLTIHDATDDDFFMWTASRDGTLGVEIVFEDSLGDLDLFLYEADRSDVAGSSGVGDSELITLDVTEGSMWFVRVVGWEEQTNFYDLSIGGSAAIPEPSAALVFGIGLLLVHRRFRQMGAEGEIRLTPCSPPTQY